MQTLQQESESVRLCWILVLSSESYLVRFPLVDRALVKLPTLLQSIDMVDIRTHQ